MIHPLTPGPQLRGARAANSAAFALQGFFLAVVLTELPQQRDLFGLTDKDIVAAVALISLLAGGGSIAAEKLAVYRSSRTALRLGLLLIAASGVGVAFAPNRVVLFAALGVYGVAVGIVDAGTNMQAVFIQHGYGRFVLSSFYAAWSAGAITGALCVSLFERLGLSLRVSVLIAAAIVLAVTLAAGPRLLPAAAAESGPAETDTAAPVPTRLFLAFGIVLALAFAIDFAVGNWSALFLTDVLAASSSTAALALAAYQGASLVGRLTGDLLVRRYGPRAVVRVASIIGSIGLAVAVAAPGPAVAIAGFLVAGIGLPLIAPLCFSEAGRLTSGRGLDSVIARLNLFNYAGTLVGGVVVGALAAVTDLRGGFGATLLFALILIACAQVFHARTTVTAVPALPETGRASLDK
ncbi:MFS transporter [Nocardia sp. NPDC057668]|uniref:MFS transporter n=1 Tax=Nocardia sp. NPDC057668 TaxID=3346202 RepID=UPI0036716A09